MKKIFKSQAGWIFLILILLHPLFGGAQNKKDTRLINYVNPLIGTERMGHVFSGASVPFGRVQLSPDTDTIQYSQNGKYNPDV